MDGMSLGGWSSGMAVCSTLEVPRPKIGTPDALNGGGAVETHPKLNNHFCVFSINIAVYVGKDTRQFIVFTVDQ